MPGFKTILKRLSKKWKEEKSKIVESSEEILEMMRNISQGAESEELNEGVVTKCLAQITGAFDDAYGGFSSSPKFPSVSILNFLTRYSALESEKIPSEAELLSLDEFQIRSKLAHLGIKVPEQEEKFRLIQIYESFLKKKNAAAEEALNMCLQTLRSMAKGGIHDHISQGFHRYSTDRTWHVPHFEKMLYDQAQLAIAYLEAYQITQDESFAEVAADIFTYVERDLSDPEGGFYCAEDADSKPTLDAKESIEGAFYVWTTKDLKKHLGADAELFSFHYGAKEEGNVPSHSDVQGELAGQNVLIQRHDLAATATRFGLSETEVATIIQGCKNKLFEERNKRPRPNLDDKIVTSWNGLMISAFAKGYQILKAQKYLDRAIRAAGFFEKYMYDKETRCLLRSYRHGPSAIQGFNDDYAFFIQGLLDLYEATFEEKYLLWASTLQAKQDSLFWDSSSCSYFSSAASDSTIIMRMKDADDGAEPSSNSISLLNLFRLANFFDDAEMTKKVETMVKSFSTQLVKYPTSVTFMVSVFLFLLKSCVQVVIVGNPEESETKRLIEVAHAAYLPNRILVVLDPREKESIFQKNKSLSSKEQLHGQATAHICRNFICERPTADPLVLERRLAGL